MDVGISNQITNRVWWLFFRYYVIDEILINDNFDYAYTPLLKFPKRSDLSLMQYSLMETFSNENSNLLSCVNSTLSTIEVATVHGTAYNLPPEKLTTLY